MKTLFIPLLAIALVADGTPASAQSAANVAVVINDASDASRTVGEYYVRQRAIPSDNVIHLRTATTEIIERAAYDSTIERPIAEAIGARSLHDRVLYLVLTKGVPLRIAGTTGNEGTTSSVDSELTLLYRRIAGQGAPVIGRVANPYFLGDKPIGEAERFSHRAYDILLVSRLDAFTLDEVTKLIDRAQKPAAGGRVVLDQRAMLGADAIGDRWLGEAAERLIDGGQGDRVVLEDTATAARNVDGVIGYFSWGSNDAANRSREVAMRFQDGAIAATFVSTDARTFQAPPEDWQPAGKWDDRRTWFAGSPQTLLADFIRQGATGAGGHVAEPYMQSTFRPDILFPAYVAGFNLVEAFYLALPHLSWQGVVIGDPLCQPFARATLATADIEGESDPSTELPGFFSKRRLANARAAAKDLPDKALTLVVLAESRQARGDIDGARKALEEATAVAPQFLGAQFQLATLYERQENRPAAIARYRTILEVQPKHVAALNNLAYALAVHQGQPAEGLPFAKRAVALRPGDPTILDTLGWIEYLLGNHRAAATVLSDAARLEPDNGEIFLHAAIALQAVGLLKESQTHLDKALRLDSALRGRDDVRQLREQLKRGEKPRSLLSRQDFRASADAEKSRPARCLSSSNLVTFSLHPS